MLIVAKDTIRFAAYIKNFPIEHSWTPAGTSRLSRNINALREIHNLLRPLYIENPGMDLQLQMRALYGVII